MEEENYTVYGAILAASDGRVILLSEESCACSGGKTHLGLTEKREIPWKMLVEGEKLGYDVKSILGWGSLYWSMITYPSFRGSS
ncbi:MAG: DUF169 domain-containing protein [Methanophagales archaeon]|nr:DUF169 domain-containing protein [Methanophagales archaeon]